MVVARQHADGQEDEQHGRPDAARDQPGHDAEQPEAAAEQYQAVRPGHRRVVECQELSTRHIATTGMGLLPIAPAASCAVKNL